VVNTVWLQKNRRPMPEYAIGSLLVLRKGILSPSALKQRTRYALSRRRQCLSEATKPAPDPKVLLWLRKHEALLTVDPIILGELRFGILLMSEGKRKKTRVMVFGRHKTD